MATKMNARQKWAAERLAQVLRESDARDAEAAGRAPQLEERAKVEDGRWFSHFVHSFTFRPGRGG